MEKEEKEKATRFSTALSIEFKDKGKGILDGPSSLHPTSMEDTLQKGAEFKKNLERINSHLQTDTKMVESQSKKKKTQLSS